MKPIKAWAMKGGIARRYPIGDYPPPFVTFRATFRSGRNSPR